MKQLISELSEKDIIIEKYKLLKIYSLKEQFIDLTKDYDEMKEDKQKKLLLVINPI